VAPTTRYIQVLMTANVMASPAQLNTMDSNPAAEPTAASLESTIQGHIQALTALHTRIQSLRQVPNFLLRPPHTSGTSDFSSSFDVPLDGQTITHNSASKDFRNLRDIMDTLRSEPVQDALRTAAKSEEGDRSDTAFSIRRRQNNRPPSPIGSPQPYVPPPPRPSMMFLSGEDERQPLCADGLVEYIKEFNRANSAQPVSADSENFTPKCRLHIWKRSRSTPPADSEDEVAALASATNLASPLVLRFTILDVMTVYMPLTFSESTEPLSIESVTAFGPREKKLPHMQSDYLAYQVLSQHVAKILEAHPQTPVQKVIDLLAACKGLFTDRCTRCQRILSEEDHVPPVARFWRSGASATVTGASQASANASVIQPSDTDAAHRGGVTDHSFWEPRHVTCLYS